MSKLFFALLLGAALPALAETPQQMLSGYAAEAAKSQGGFAASAERGRQFFLQKRSVKEQMPSCSSCHTDDPRARGSHAITHKAIDPLAPAADARRFTDLAKTEKWFRRNCSEVLGRECTAAEKADLIQFLLSRG